jgi:hypothetical protein
MCNLREELARRHNHMVAKPTRNDRVMHHRLVRLILEVAVPARSELRTWPTIHHLEFFLSRANLDSSLDSICRKRSSSVDVPLLEDPLLDCWVTTGEVVEGLDMRLRAVRGECEADGMLVLYMKESDLDLLVVLEVETHTWQVDEWLDAGLAELLGVTNTRALENEWRAKSSSRHDDLLACLDDARRQLSIGEVLGWDDLDTDGSITLEDDL